MRNDTLTAVIAAGVISGVVCLLLGGAAAYMFMGTSSSTAPSRVSSGGPPVATTESASSNEPAPAKADSGLADDLRAATERADRLAGELKTVTEQRDAATGDLQRLNERVTTLEKELVEARKATTDKPPAPTGAVPVTFGSYGELAELKNADWKELGGALQAMTPEMEPLAKAIREGKQPDPEVMKRIGAQNMKLVKLAVALQGKLPTHTSNVNGEYTHPVTIVNLLASQLAAAGNPLTDAQKKRLSELGDDYERRWKTQNDAYTAETFQLQKILDEAELKQWFTDQMWQVTTPEQKALVVSPNNEGYLGIDLYSPALMFQGIARPLQAPSRDVLKGHMKDWLANNFGVPKANFDTAEFALDDWLTSLNVEPKTAAEASFMHIREILATGKAQLTLYANLLPTALNDPEVVKKVRAEDALVVPQVLQQ